MIKFVEELFKTEPDILFSKAQEIGRKKKPIYCSPNILTGDCTTRPICRHCKWENLKSINLEFNKKRTIDEVVMRTKVLVDAGIDRMFVASGWMGYTVPNYFYEYISAIKENSSIEIFGLFGSINKESLKCLKNVGMDGFLCGLESPNENIY